MPPIIASRVPRWILACLGVCLVAGLTAATAQAYDSYPCGPETTQPWTTQPVQLCPLNSPLPPNGWIPVYRQPVANQPNTTPAPAGWLHGTSNQYFVCQQLFSSDVYYHPQMGWYNNWWAWTLSDDNVWGWVPEVFFTGGNNNEPDSGLRVCGTQSPPPPPPPPPSPGPSPSPPPSTPCAATPTSAGMHIAAHVTAGRSARRQATVVTVNYRQRVLVAGRLTANGAPLAATTICVAARMSVFGAATQPLASVTTDSQGRFTFPWRAGASLRMWLVYSSASATATASVLVRVRPLVTLRASPRSLSNGQSVTLRGRLGGRPIPKGVLVEVQALRTSGWQTFGTTNVRTDGTFSFRYRFTRTSGVQTYDLRVRVPAQLGYAFTPGASRPVAVTVRG